MTIDDIMTRIKAFQQVPTSKLRQKMIHAVQNADGSLRNALFSSTAASSYLTYNAQQGQEALKQFAVKYTAFVVSQSTSRSFNATVCNISYETIRQWFSTYGATVGLWMTVDCLVEDQALAALLANKNESLAIMVESGKDPVFVNGFLIECDTAGTCRRVDAKRCGSGEQCGYQIVLDR